MAVTRTTWSEVLERRRLTPEVRTLDITFCDIGWGDCTIIWLPNSKVVVVDCGSRRWGGVTPEEVRTHLPEDDTGSKLPIDVLILTHPDSDHYNQCLRVIQDVTIHTVLYGNAQRNYAAMAFRSWWWGRQETQGGAKFGSVRAAVDVRPGSDEPGHIISGGADCDLWTIAANVQAQNPESPYGVNTGSVVVRGKFRNESFIVAADATCETEDFMIANQLKWPDEADLNVDILRVAHHGSQSSSSQRFLDEVGAGDAIISCSERNAPKLPREPVTRRVENMVAGGDSHWISFYDDDGHECNERVEDAIVAPPEAEPDVEPGERKITKRLWVTGVTGEETYTLDGK